MCSISLSELLTLSATKLFHSERQQHTLYPLTSRENVWKDGGLLTAWKLRLWKQKQPVENKGHVDVWERVCMTVRITSAVVLLEQQKAAGQSHHVVAEETRRKLQTLRNWVDSWNKLFEDTALKACAVNHSSQAGDQGLNYQVHAGVGEQNWTSS